MRPVGPALAITSSYLLLVFTAACTSGEAAEPGSVTRVAAEASHETWQIPANGVRLEVAPEGNRARYLVREQLAGFDLPNDAVAVTNAVRGAIVLNADGAVDPAASQIVVDVTGLTSDSDRRDGYVRRRVLLTEEHPAVTLRPTTMSGITLPLPENGTRALELRGDLTVNGTTRPTTWRVNATFAGSRVTGTAATAFTFEDFGIAQPRVPVVLSVADTIRLEYDFNLVASPVARGS
jgi:polyisoprenoid-binding protein YceI